MEVVCQRTVGTTSGPVNGVLVHRLPRIDRRPFRTISYLTVLAAFLLLRLRRFDLVHVHLANLQADVAVALAHILSRGSYVKLAAGGPLGEIGRFRRVAKVTRYFGIRRANVVQAISREIADDLRAISVQPDRVRTIPNGVRIPQIRAGLRAETRERLGLHDSEVVVLTAARLEREKGVGDLLTAWRIRPLNQGHLLIVGSMGIKEPVDVSLLPPGAQYLGWTADIEPYLAATDVFVLASHSEGMSNALLEAMALGLPCVATRVGAATEMIDDGYSGILVEAGDVTALSGAIHRLAADRAIRERMGRQASRAVAKRFGIEAVVLQIIRAYGDIAGRS